MLSLFHLVVPVLLFRFGHICGWLFTPIPLVDVWPLGRSSLAWDPQVEIPPLQTFSLAHQCCSCPFVYIPTSLASSCSGSRSVSYLFRVSFLTLYCHEFRMFIYCSPYVLFHFLLVLTSSISL